MTESNLALLIDGDNVSPKIIAGLLAEITKYGTASVKRIYGDWTSPTMNSWKACLLDHSITPIQQFAYTTGKNATDGAMIIDAMDLLYTGRFKSFCLVSSDSDFTRLAARIREQGVTVYGFGERKTPNPLIAACDKFIYFDALVARSDEVPFAAAPGYPKPGVASDILQKQTIQKRPIDARALEGVRVAISNAMEYKDGWANLADVGAMLNKLSPDLHQRNYGYDKLRDFIEATGRVNLKSKPMGNHPPVIMVCLKDDDAA